MLIYVDVDEEFTGDVDIDFSKYNEEQLKKILRALLDGDTYTFEDVDLYFSGEVEIDYEPY